MSRKKDRAREALDLDALADRLLSAAGPKNRRAEGQAFSPLQLLREAGWRQTGSEPRCANCQLYVPPPRGNPGYPGDGQGSCARTRAPQVPDGICLGWAALPGP